jgi:type I restriction enzyme M protein
MFEQAFRNIDDVLRKEADRATEAKLEGRKYTRILGKPYRWRTWAAPRTKEGKLDYNKALTGDDIRDFVDKELFPHLQGFKQRATGPDTIEYKIGEIFGEIKNKIQSGYNLREIIDQIDELQFRSQAEKHELSVKNPNNIEEVVHRSPQEIMEEITTLDTESADVLKAIRGLLKEDAIND